MKNIEELITTYNVKVAEIVLKFHNNYLMKNVDVRDINTAKSYYDEHLDKYKSDITYIATQLLHEASFEIKANDFDLILQVAGKGIQELFLVVMKSSL